MKLSATFTLPLFSLLFLACGSNETAQTEQTPEVPSLIETVSCYASIVGKDTLSLRLEVLGNDVAGELSYNLFEKDGNEGTIRGEMHGDTLIADYTYTTEGIESVRQVVFLQQNGGFVEGYGETTTRNGRMVYENPASLEFDRGMVFEKAPCVD
ncbi:MAG: hypothetical protein KKG00_02900 [Bacteroidetes bacterium]|nr:hypothetical protein [Bacteroidota bacterium]